MPRVYRHIEPYQEEILKLKEQGLSHREIGEKLGFSKVQIKEFFKRLRRKERKIAAGIVLKKKGLANERFKNAHLQQPHFFV